MSGDGADSLPASWATECLGNLDVAIFDGPFGSHLKTSDYVDSGVRVIRLENIGQGRFIDENQSFVSKEKYDDIRKHTVVPGDIVFSSFVTESIRSALVPSHIPFAVNKADCFGIHFRGETTDSKFVQFFLQSRSAHRQVEGMIHGVGRPRINTSQLKELVVPVAPTREQTRIVAKIEELFSELDKGVEALTATREQLAMYEQSVLRQAFDGTSTAAWREKNRGTVGSPDAHIAQLKREREAYSRRCQRLAAISPIVPVEGKDGDDRYLPAAWTRVKLNDLALDSVLGKMLDRKKNKGRPRTYLGNINVRWGRFDVDSTKTMPIEDGEVDRYSLKCGDLVICEGGEPGRCAVWEGADDEVFVQKALHRVRLPKSYNPYFAYYYLVYAHGAGLLERAYTGTTIKHLTGIGLADVCFPLCSFAEQTEVVRRLQEALSLANELTTSIDGELLRAQGVRQSILKQAFTGQLIAQNAKDEPASVLLERIRAEQEGTTAKRKPAIKSGKKKGA